MQAEHRAYDSHQLSQRAILSFKNPLGLMSNSQEIEREFSGLAALSICESLLLALSDLKVVSHQDVRGVLEDAAAAHRNAIGTPQEIEGHRVVAAIIDRVLSGRHLTTNEIPRVSPGD
jgi:hypothetical protein